MGKKYDIDDIKIISVIIVLNLLVFSIFFVAYSSKIERFMICNIRDHVSAVILYLPLNNTEAMKIDNTSIAKLENKGYDFKQRYLSDDLDFYLHKDDTAPHSKVGSEEGQPTGNRPRYYILEVYIRRNMTRNNIKKSDLSIYYRLMDSAYLPNNEDEFEKDKEYLTEKATEVGNTLNLTLNWDKVRFEKDISEPQLP